MGAGFGGCYGNAESLPDDLQKIEVKIIFLFITCAKTVCDIEDLKKQLALAREELNQAEADKAQAEVTFCFSLQNLCGCFVCFLRFETVN